MSVDCLYHHCQGIIPPYMQKLLLEKYEAEMNVEAERGGLGVAAAESPAARRYRLQLASMDGRGDRSIRSIVADEDHGMGMASAVGAEVHARRSTIEVWNAYSTKLLLTPGGDETCGDRDADVCYKNVKKTDEFYRTVLGVQPVYGQGGTILARVHHPDGFNNAFWSSKEETINFFDHDGRVYNSFVEDFSITTHELGHAVVHYSSDLRYEGQSGALNESIADVFAIAAMHWNSKVSADRPETEWLIAKGLIKGARSGSSLRSMSEPGTAFLSHPDLGSDPQPAHMLGYQRLPNTQGGDWGGVHINSGIPNKAFYLAAMKIGKGSWEVAAPVWHHALRESKSTSNFEEFALQTIKSVRALRTPNGEAVENEIGKAWEQVGVL